MKLAIVDDLKTDSDRLAGFVHTYMEQHQLKLDALDQFESGESFLSGFTSGSYDLIFLDIYMTGITGMETAKKIRQTDHDCRLIFITTSPEFAVESYDVNAVFYLLKPIRQEQVFTALDRCALRAREDSRTIDVPTALGTMPLPLHKISYTEHVNRQILVHFKDGRKMEVPINQKSFSALLLEYPWFCDCIKGMLVNFEDVDKLLDDRFLLKSGVYIPISRLKYKDVREQFLEYSYSAVRGGSYGGAAF